MNDLEKFSRFLGKLWAPTIILCLPLAYIANKKNDPLLAYNVFWLSVLGVSFYLISINNKWIYSQSIKETSPKVKNNA